MKKDINWYLLCKINEGVSVDTINSIIDLGASVDAINPYTSESALIMAVRKDNFDVINYIIERTKLINHKDKNGKTALMYAAETSNRFLVQLLIDQKSDIYIVDKTNKSALDYVESNGIREIFEKIIKQESSENKKKEIEESAFLLYDPETLDKELQGEHNERREHYLTLLDKSGPSRELIKIVHESIKNIQLLESKFPNFKNAIEYYVEQLHLCNITEERYIEFKPLLITGVPGVGKTQFCSEVAASLNLNLNIIQCSSTTAGFVIGGGSAQWSGARPGKVHTILRDSDAANPFILLDEIDKMAGDIRYDSYGSLYSLLEKNTAKNFVDELIDIPVDCSRINWIATANDLNSIPEPILSRFSIIKIREPNKDEIGTITSSIYTDILKENPWGKRFSKNLDDNLMSLLVNISPRQIKSVLITGCGKAVSSRKCEQYELQTGDIELTLTDKKPSVGFIN
jgi:ATP-dependent Lon protease